MIAKARRRGMSEGVVLYCENETLKSRGQWNAKFGVDGSKTVGNPARGKSNTS